MTNQCLESNGAISSTLALMIQPVAIEEVESNGTIAASALFPQNGYTVDSSVDGKSNQFFRFSLSSPFSVITQFCLRVYLTNYFFRVWFRIRYGM